MKKQFTIVSKIVIAAGITFSLAACHSDNPSESEAKAVVQQEFTDCKYIKMSNFDKINGIPQDDGSYRVDVKYTLKLAEPDGDLEDRIKEQGKISDQIAQIQSDFADSMKKSQAAHAEFMTQHQDNQMQGEEQWNNGGDSGQEGRKADIKQIQDLQQELFSNNALAVYNGRIRQACPNLRPSTLMNFFSSKLSINDIEDGAKMDFTGQIAMINSDNGWIAPR